MIFLNLHSVFFLPHRLSLEGFSSCPHCKRTLSSTSYVGEHCLSAKTIKIISSFNILKKSGKTAKISKSSE